MDRRTDRHRARDGTDLMSWAFVANQSYPSVPDRLRPKALLVGSFFGLSSAVRPESSRHVWLCDALPLDAHKTLELRDCGSKPVDSCSLKESSRLGGWGGVVAQLRIIEPQRDILRKYLPTPAPPS